MPGRVSKVETRQRIEEALTANLLKKMPVAASRDGGQRDYRARLEFIARLSGGRQKMIDFARGCDDDRTQDMVRTWDGLGRAEKKYSTLAQLCEVNGIEEREFLGKVIAALWSDGADVTIRYLPSSAFSRCRFTGCSK